MNPNKFFGHPCNVIRMIPTFFDNVWLAPLVPNDICIPLCVNTDRNSNDTSIVFAMILSKNGLCEIAIQKKNKKDTLEVL